MGRLAALVSKVQRAARARGPGPAPTVQAQLAINPPGDRFEHEADRIASQVVRSSGPAVAPPVISRVESSAQRAVVPATATIESTGKPKEEPKKEEAQRAPLQRASARRDDKVQRSSHGDKEAEKPLQRAPTRRDEKAQRASHGDKEAEKPLQRAPAKRAEKVQRASHGDKQAEKPLQRALAKHDDKVQRKTGRAEDKVQRAEAANTLLHVPAGVEQSLQGMRGRGEAMAPELRTQMEQGFGRSFEDVRLHRSPAAGDAAQALNARAFTVGNDVFFGRGEYQPRSQAGQHLIAHELTHTVQQTGGARAVQRAVPPQGNEAARPAEKKFVSPTGKGEIEIGAAASGDANFKGRFSIPKLALPTINGKPKGAAGNPIAPGVHAEGRGAIPDKVDTPFEIRQPTERVEIARDRFVVDAAKSDISTTLEKAVETKYGEMALIDVGNTKLYYLKLKQKTAKANFFNGTAAEIARHPDILSPVWRRNGILGDFAVDHIHELQLGGYDGLGNFWLLDKSINSSIGSRIAGQMKKGIDALVREAGAAFWKDNGLGEPSAREVKANWVIAYGGIEPLTDITDKSRYWTRADITAGVQLEALEPMSESEVREFWKGEVVGPKGGPRKLRVFKAEFGGVYGCLLESNGVYVLPPFVRGTILPGYPRIHDAKLVDFPADFGLGEKTSYGKIEGNLLRDLSVPEGPIERPIPISLPLKSLPRLGLNLFTDTSQLMPLISRGGIRVRGLSPVSITSADFDENGDVVIIGAIAPTLKVFQKFSIPFVITGDRLAVRFPLNPTGLDFGPIAVTDASLAIVAGGQGLGLEGEAGIAIRGLGAGRIRAGVVAGAGAKAGGQGGEADTAVPGQGGAASAPQAGPGLILGGQFNFDFDKFDPAFVDVQFANDKWSGAGKLGLKPESIKGISSAEVNVSADETGLKVDGTATLDVPGLEGTQLSVKRDPAGNLDIGADHIPLPIGKIPGVKGGEASIHAVRQADSGEWTLKGSGTAQFGVPGVSGALTVAINGQLVTVQGSAAIQRGLMSGQASFLATNRPLDPSGQPIDGPPGDLQASGEGKVTLQLGRYLQGTAGLKFKPDGEMEIIGRIALPPTVDLFKQEKVEKTLFSTPPIDIPILGLAAGGHRVGIFATIGGDLKFIATLGGGQLVDTALTVTYNPSRPDEATVDGKSSFVVPAMAGLRLGVHGAVGVGAAVISVEGGVDVGATLGIAAEARADVDVNWTPQRGLALEARASFEARPQFTFDVTLFVKAIADVVITEFTLYERRWTPASFTAGPSLGVGISMPVGWSEAGGINFDPNRVEIKKPDIDVKAVIGDAIRQITGG
ncbi:eCIS core domain-containing protein [Bradyrhizobium japonicum]|uniref:eCIS core domain-containing protein n=1 Tax=Bradyrhizobium japonicum TaxID=375 RepID=UPI00048601D8|nr:DUF4157 domain-containing protein [Bradyrhizobium japonicum]WLB91323.1 DUF4157 domain-containing protein [Bradyrhizobium japonicum USDA 135]